MFTLSVIFVLFWWVIPSAVAGWVLREHGRSFALGLLSGVAGGPFGVLGVLIFLTVEGRGGKSAPKGNRSGVPLHYRMPLIGTLHASTVWILAGFTIFLCFWVLSGVSFEIYRAHRAAELMILNAPPQTSTRDLATDAMKTLAENERSAEHAAAGIIREHAATPASPSQNSYASSAVPRSLQAQTVGDPGQPDARVHEEKSEPENSTHEAETPPAPTPNETKSTTPTTSSLTQSRDAAISAIKRQLLSNGHRVHASLSGDSQTATLSLTGPTLTREAGNQVLGNKRMREVLKSAGIRIVVVVSGQGSWTYLL